jgi:hypothetical protein
MTQDNATHAPPAPPTPPAPGANVVTTRALGAAPLTAQDVAALQARRSELSDQLRSAEGRRRSLSEAARRAEGQDKAGLQQRIAVLDGRLARLESDIDDVGRQLASAPAALIASQQDPVVGWGPNTRNRFSENLAPITIVFTLFVLSPIALSMARMLWKRGSLPRQSALPAADTTQRLERMEQAMEAIAIEVERVSEGQRFVTRILSEGRGPGQQQAPKDPVRVSAGKTPV